MKNNSLADFLGSSIELVAIDHFLQLLVKTNTFDQRLSILQEKLNQTEYKYQEEIKKLTQQYNEQLSFNTSHLESKHHQEIERLEQEELQKIKSTFINHFNKKDDQDVGKAEKITLEVNTTSATKVASISGKAKTINVKVRKQHTFTKPDPKKIKNEATHINNELERGVWTDSKTGLMWARISIGQGWKDGQRIGCAQTLNWEDAKKACQDFRLSNYDDWRLPTISELRTLMMKSKVGCNSPEGVLFSTGHNEWGEYWSETLLGNNISAWSVDFNNGISYTYNKNEHNYARLVRTAF